MNKEIRLTISLPPISKKNHQEIVKNFKTGKPFLIQSKFYRDYERHAGWFILGGMRRLKISAPVNVKCLFYMPTRRRCDLVNLLGSIDDVLVKYGVLADDNSNIIVSHDGSRVLYDKANPRTEVTITFYDSSP